MKISKKCQYALKAVFELAWRDNGRPVSTSQIAEAQRISPRFTEIILNELKNSGFVESRRGNDGGYMLSKDPAEISVREIIECIEGPIDMVKNENQPDSIGTEALSGLWEQVNESIRQVCEKTSFASLVKHEREKREKCVFNYNI